MYMYVYDGAQSMLDIIIKVMTTHIIVKYQLETHIQLEAHLYIFRYKLPI